MKYNNRDVDKRRQAITVKQNATNSKVYSKQALEKLASGGYKNRVPELKKTQTTVSQNNVPKTSAPKQTTDSQVKPATRYQNQNIAKNVEQPKQTKRDTTYDRDFDTFHTYRYEKADMMDYDEKTGDSNPHWQTLKKQIMGKNKWTESQFDEKWEAYNRERNQKDADKEVKNAIELGKEHPLLASFLQLGYTPQTIIEGGASMLSNLGRTEEKAQSSDSPMFTGMRAQTGLTQAVKDNHINSKVGQAAYNIATELPTMAFGPAAYAARAAERTNMNALDRGVDPDKAAATGALAGAASYATNKLGDKVTEKVLGTGKTALGQVLRKAAGEGGENFAEDTSNLIVDSLMNRDKSQLSALHDYYTSQGMTDDQANVRVALDTLGDLGTSFGTGALWGGVMGGAGRVPELVGDVRALIPEMNNRGAVDPKALAEEAGLNLKASAKVEGEDRALTPQELDTLQKVVDEADAQNFITELRDRFANAKPVDQADMLVDGGYYRDHVQAGEAYSEGKFNEAIEDYLSKMERNGNPAPTKNTVDTNNSSYNLKDKYNDDWEQMRRGVIKEYTNASDEQVEKYKKELDKLVSFGGWSKADPKVLDDYVEHAPTYQGQISRGMHFEPGDGSYDNFMDQVRKSGTVTMGKPSSWTTDPETSRLYSHMGDDTYDSVEIVCNQNRTSTPINYINMQGEDEILSSSKASWTVLNEDTVTRPNGSKKTILYVAETGDKTPPKNAVVMPAIEAKTDDKLTKEKEQIIEQLNKLANGNLKSGELIKLGETPRYLAEYGNVDNPLVMDQSTVNKIVYPEGYLGGKHNLGYDAIANIPEQFNNPVAMLKSNTYPKSGVIMTDMLDASENPVFAPVHMDKDSQMGTVNKVSTMLGRRDAEPFYNNSEVNFENKERVANVLSGTGLQLSELSSQADPIFNSKIRQGNEKVNTETDGSIPPEPPRRSLFDDLPRSDKEGKSKVGTNTAVNSNVYTRKQIENDPIISELNKYAKANNDLTFNQAKEDIINEGSQILEDYTSGKRTISNDLDVDRAMILLTDMAQKISDGDSELIPQRDLLFSKLRQAGTLHGQTIQAFKKWNNTAEGAIINGERIIDDSVKSWKTQNKKKVELNGRIAKALEQMGVDSSMRNKPQTEKTHEQVKQGVKNVIEREFGSVENLFNDNDIEYLTSLAENKEIPVWVITDEIEHKMNHGEWYTIDESTPVKLETSSKLASILKNMGNDSLKEKNKLPDLGYGESHASIVQKIRKTLAQDPAAVDLDNPADVEVLANFIEEKIPNWQIEDEIHHRLMTGEWYTLDESIEPKKPINQRLKNALDDLVEKGPAPEKEPPTLDEIRNEVKATLDKEMARTGDFTDDDVNYLASLIQNGATKQELSEALNTKMATGKFGISPETQQQVSDLFTYANRFDPNSKQAFDLRTAAYKLLAEETVSDDATPFEKFESWRYLAMLGNPKTMVRNWIGNKMFGAVTGVSNNLSAALEAGTDKLSKALGGEGIQRTKAILNPVNDRALIKAAGEDGEAHRYTELSGSKYEKGTKDAIRQQKSAFNSKLLRLYEAVTDRGISDYSAVKKKYSTSLAGYMKANGLDESAFDANDRYIALIDKSRSQLLTNAEKAEMDSLKSTVDTLEKARDYAVKQAEYATFHEDNDFANWLTKTSNSAPGPLRMVIEGLVPFKKTPANILNSGLEYSPLGAVKSIAETGKLIYENTGKRKGNLDDTYIKKSKLTGKEKEISKSLAADVLDSWSKTLTGTGLVGLGFYLKNKGILNSSNKDEKWQDDLEGKQNYSITINGKTYTLDWAAPAVMPLLMGAEIAKIKDRNNLLDQKWYANLSEAIGTANAIFDPIFETSMMQGVKNTLEQAASDIKYNEDNAIGGIIGSMALNTGLGYMTQALPTISGQVARTVDNTRRTTDTTSDGALGVLEKQGRKIMNKIPGLSMLNQPYYDSYGRTQNNGPFNNPLGNMAYQMLMPAYVRDINTTAADESARNAYYGLGEPNEEGKQLPIMDAKVFPSWKSKVTVGGEKFTPEEMASYRKTSGEAQYAIRDALTKEEWFNNLDASQQTELLKKVNTLVDKIGKDSVDKLDSSSKEFEAYQEGGVEGLLNKWSGDIYTSKAKEETGLNGSTNAMKEIKAAYAEGDTKKGDELTKKYNKYNKERERLNEKYGVNITMSDFTEREDANPGSNEAWAKEHASGATTNTTTTTTKKTSTVPEVNNNTSNAVDTAGYEKFINRAGNQSKKFTNDIPKLKELNYKENEMYTYAYAIKQDSNLTPQSFKAQYDKLNLDGKGAATQDEMINYFNQNNTSEKQANYLWRTYGENKGTPWKTLPVLKNGTWKKNK